MPKYRFSSLGADDAVLSSCLREADSDEEAREIAVELLTHSNSEAIEVWNVFQLVHRAVRDASHSVPLIISAGKPRAASAPEHHRH